jgi:hypothetical protein
MSLLIKSKIKALSQGKAHIVSYGDHRVDISTYCLAFFLKLVWDKKGCQNIDRYIIQVLDSIDDVLKKHEEPSPSMVEISHFKDVLRNSLCNKMLEFAGVLSITD